MKIMCPHCGAPNLDTSAACYSCDKPLTTPKEVEQPDAAEVPKKSVVRKR